MRDVLTLTLADFNLSQFSNEELCEISCNLNCWMWDDRLGEKPEGAGVYMSDEHSLISRALRKAIEEKVGHKAISKYWNTRYRKRKPMAEEEFEVFYENQLASGGFHIPSYEFMERNEAKLRKRIARKRLKTRVKEAIFGFVQRSPRP